MRWFHAIFAKQMARRGESKFPQFLNHRFYVKSYFATLGAQKLQFWPFCRPWILIFEKIPPLKVWRIAIIPKHWQNENCILACPGLYVGNTDLQNRTSNENNGQIWYLPSCWSQVLNLKEVSPDVWQRIDLLMDHNETMKDDESSVWQSQVVEMILNSGLKNWTRNDIFRAVGIVNTNAVSCGLANGTALYTSFSFLSHRYVHMSKIYVNLILANVRDPKSLQIKDAVPILKK